MKKNEIDLVELEKMLTKNFYNSKCREEKIYFKYLENLFLIISGEYISIKNSFDDSLLFLSDIIIILGVINLILEQGKSNKNKAEIFSEVITEIKNEIRKSNEYRDLREEYNNYVVSLAKFIKSQGIIDGPGIAFLYQHMLDSGYLSYHKKHEYYNSCRHKNVVENATRYEIEELWGSRISTGSSVCRHMSSLLTDIENEIGNSAHTLKVFYANKNIPVSYYSNFIPDHCINVITTDNNIFGYCPTNKLVLSLKTDYENIPPKLETYLSLSPVLGKSNFNSILVARDNDNYKIDNSFEENHKISQVFRLENLNNYDMETLYKRRVDIMKYLYVDNGIKELNNYYENNIDTLRSIKEKTEYLTPLTTDKVKKLIIHK